MNRPQARRVEDLRRNIVRLAALTTGAIRGGTDALLDNDLEAAGRIIDDDDAVDALRHSIEDECLYLLGQPGSSPTELRQVGTTMRVVYELERSADLMVNVAKTTWRLHPYSLDPVSRSIVERLCGQVIVQTRMAVNAFVDLDPSGAAALVDMDDTVDELHKALLRHLLAAGAPVPNDDATVVRAVQLALVAHHYERIGDHAVNIAEQVYRVTNGRRRTRARRPPVPAGL
jgi:phosphate transport system protein